MGDNRPPVYWDEIDGTNSIIIRASALGHDCIWELVACGQGYEPLPYPDKLVLAFEESSEWEEPEITYLKTLGYRSIGEEQLEGELYCGEVGSGRERVPVYVRYHPDFPCLRPSGTEVLVEVKAFSHELFVRAERYGVHSVFSEYSWQLGVMCAAYQLPGEWVVADKSSTKTQPELLYQDAEGLIPGPVAITKKAQQIAKGVLGKDIVQSGKKCPVEDYWPCRFLHLRPQEVSIEPVREDLEDEFNRVVEAYSTALAMEAEGKVKKDEAKAAYLELFGRDKRMLSNMFVVTRVDSHSTSYDYSQMFKDMREAGLDPDKYKKTNSYSYPKVRRNGRV